MPETSRTSVYRQIARGVVVVVAALYTWHARYFVNPDGVAYLDVADRYLAGGWNAAIYPHRSPLYPWLLAMANRVLGGNALYESTIAHGVTFLLYCLAFAAYELLLRQLRRAKLSDGMPDAVWIPLAYVLFLWCCNFADQTGPSVLTPDLLVAAAVFAGSALLVRIANGSHDWPTYLALGGLLGAGYLAKEAMLPISIFMLIAAAVAGGRQVLRRVAVSAALFAAIASAYFVPLSLQLGRPSTGETARYNYILWVASAGRPDHPRLVLQRVPLVLGYPEAAAPGAYAVLDDLRFWLHGMRPRFDLHAQLHAIARSVGQYSEILRSPVQFALLLAFLTLLFSSSIPWESLRRCWVLTLPSLAALAMYGLVLVQPRYVSPPLAVLWIGLFAGFSAQSYHLAKRAMAAACVALIIILAPAAETREQMQKLRQPAVNVNWLVAEHLGRAGVAPGDRVAVMGGPYMCYWARLAKVRVAAEVMDPHEFWASDEPARVRALAALERFGVRAVIAAGAPSGTSSCWQRVQDTTYSVCVPERPDSR